MLPLPEKFLDRMENQLQDEYQAFLLSYQEPRMSGLRANTLKISPCRLQEMVHFLAHKVPWCDDGFYFLEEARPAKHPYYSAGLYYIQEPSAMLPAELLAAQPGERVLDLCAAPGGKSVQLAGQLARDGLLVANDNHPQRVKILLKNLERCGAVNIVVTNETPVRLAKVFGGYFDKILVDAPCSGEGMFRRDTEMVQAWSDEAVSKYAAWQRDILAHVPALLRPGGQVVYSTCTFAAAENEDQVKCFLTSFPDFSSVAVQQIWPHKQQGEGHFAAKLAHSDKGNGDSDSKCERKREQAPVSPAALQALEEFSASLWGCASAWQNWLPHGGSVVERSGHILWEASCLPDLKGLTVLRSGWLLGMWDKGRFKPSQAYAMGLPSAAVAAASKKYDFSVAQPDDRQTISRYLRGETIVTAQDRASGWYLVAIDGFPLGWAKGAGHTLKNFYPPGWRWED